MDGITDVMDTNLSRLWELDREAWHAAVLEVAKSQTRLSKFTFTFHFHELEKEMARSLAGCRLWGCTESDMTEAT